jgi:hypothetical protein
LLVGNTWCGCIVLCSLGPGSTPSPKTKPNKEARTNNCPVSQFGQRNSSKENFETAGANSKYEYVLTNKAK